MARFVMRVWLPDNPGALGRVASAIGSVGASLVGIDILEQGGGYAVDELVVDAVESSNAEEKLIAALMLLEGVQVEEIVLSSRDVLDPRLDALRIASEFVGQETKEGLQTSLVSQARSAIGAQWAAIISFATTEDAVVASVGDAPGALWLRAFVEGSRMSGQTPGPDDTAWADMIKSDAALVVGREGGPFRNRDRSQLEAMANIADRLLAVLPQ
jgi:hypothetical protein